MIPCPFNWISIIWSTRGTAGPHILSYGWSINNGIVKSLSQPSSFLLTTFLPISPNLFAHRPKRIIKRVVKQIYIAEKQIVLKSFGRLLNTGAFSILQ